MADYDPPHYPVRGYRQQRTATGELLHVWEGARLWIGRLKGNAETQ